MNNKKTQELEKTYQLFIDSFVDLEFPIEQIDQFVDPEINGYGTTNDEHITGLDDYIRLVHRQRDQSKGAELKVDRRPVLQRISPNEDAALIIEELTVTLAFEDGNHEIPLRISSILHFIDGGWRIVHWHGSQPVASENDTWHLDEWRQKNEALQKLVDEKTADITAKNRELEIEAALERIRSSANAMQDSTELADVIKVVFQETIALGFGAKACDLVIFDPVSGGAQFWISGDLNDEVIYARIPKLKIKHYTESLKAWERGDKLRSATLKGKSCQAYMRQIIDKMEESNISYEIKELLLNLDTIHHTEAFTKHGLFRAAGDAPLRQDEEEILVRFAKVFEQTYTRFLDLQKSEAQAREAQIEAALERVRTASITMQKGDELSNVISVVFKQLVELGFDADGCGLNLYNGNDGMDMWMSGFGEDIHPEHFHIDFFDHPYYQQQLNTWKTQKPYEVLSFEGELKTSYDEQTFSNPDFFNVPEDIKATFLEKNKALSSSAYMRYGMLEIVGDHELSDGEANILCRFAKVFEQTYTRFLDLQKAETQAREAQIEAALERVRAQAMAMHNTDDLGKTIEVYFEQLDTLSHTPIVRCGAGLLSRENTFAQMWTASRTPEGDTFSVEGTINMQGHPLLESTYEHWLKQEEHTYVLQGQEIQEYYDYITNQVATANNSDEALYFYFPMFAEGSFYVIANQEIPEKELKVFRRFSSVLSLTYRRFNDLKKAEAQARESEIELSLERIRAAATAMSTSSDLQDIVVAMRKEFVTLGYEANYFWHMRWLPYRYDKAMTTGDGDRIGMVMRLPRHIHGDIPLVADWEKSDEPVLVFPMDADTAVNYVNKMVTLGDFEQLDPNAPTEDAIRKIDGLTFVMARTTHGEIGYSLSGKVINPPKEAIDTLARFAGTFDLAYRRFEDLLQAEAREREAVKQASIDRVRAEIASMRSPKDLERITPLVWKELTVLGVPFFRCGVFIIKEEEEMVHAYLSTPTGKSLAALHIPFSETELGMIQPSIDNWRNQTVYREEWDQKQFIQNMQLFMKQGLIENAKQYQAGSPPPEKLVLQLVPFKQGMLYVGNSEPLIQEHVELMQYLASAFAVAYARYEDFVQLEDAKRNIEHTLTDLKAAQNQLVHSEKMASLGELTAGIAHEIQNPLNFVNNFSDLNKELLAELKEAIRENDQEEIEALTNDLLANEEKVTHHGKRAEQIVKSMLQHSRTSSGEKELTDINALCDEYLRLSYHGYRAKDKSFNADFKTEFDSALPKLNVVPQDIGRVLLNLINNAFQAVKDVEKPEVIVSTQLSNGQIQISVSDNGPGIPDDIKDKIFQPFFTTKPTGEGTGLGLSMSYDIVTKGHGGEIEVQTKTSEWTTFSISLPFV